MYHSQINDLLLTALAESFRPWTGRESLLIDVEGHGREDIGAIDVSRTIGWFTSIYPVRLSLRPGMPLDASLQSVKNQLRQIPDKGIGYGLLRDQLTGPSQAGLPQAGFLHANVLFNYLGQFDQVVAGSRLFSFASEPVGLWHHPKGKRTHLIEVLARISGGQLEVQFNFSRNVHSRTTMEQIAARYSAALMELIQPQQRGRRTTLVHCGFLTGKTGSRRACGTIEIQPRARRYLPFIADAEAFSFDGGFGRPIGF